MASDVQDEENKQLLLEGKKHTAFWLRHLRMLPTAYTSGDVQRMTLSYFCLGALDLLGVAQTKLDEEERHEYIDWIYNQQLNTEQGGGFCSSPYLPKSIAKANLAMTYTALLSLAILRDDFERLDRSAILHHIQSLQQSDGSFAASVGQAEYDCRFVYCAFAISEMLNDWTAVDVDAAVRFLLSSRSYDGGFGQGSTQESQGEKQIDRNKLFADGDFIPGGSTYCAIAALALSKRLSDIPERQKLEHWLLSRQQSLQGGFNGRIDKSEDVCYSFWCGASLKILDKHHFISIQHDIEWLLGCQTSVGGIAKTPEDHPDVMHSYLALAALSLHGQDGESEALKGKLKPIDARLNISLDCLKWLRQHLY